MSEVKNIPRLRFPEFKEEWTQNSLGDICSFSKGKGISKSDIIDNGVYECIRYGELYTHYNEVIDKVISKTNFSDNPVFSKINDVIIPASGETALDIATASCVLKKDVLLGGDLNIIRTKVNGVFLSYYLNNKRKKEIARLSQGNSVVHVYPSQLKTLKILIPHTNEFDKIADFLTAVDKRIELLEKKKTLLETYKKGVMKKIFNQEIRFKDDNGNDFPDWEEKKVKDVFRVTRGNVLSVNQMTESENLDYRYPVYSSQTKNKGVVGYYNKFLFQDSLTWTTDGANAGEVNFRKGKFYCTNVCGVLISENGFANECISNLINSVSKRYVSYVGNPKLMNGVMAEIKLAFPSIKEQEKISEFLSSIDIQIELLETQIEKSKTWKKGLLQKMFV